MVCCGYRSGDGGAGMADVTIPDLNELAGRVEALSGPDRDVDVEIVCAIDRRPDWLGQTAGQLWIDRSGRYPIIRFAYAGIGKSSGNPSVDEVPPFTTSLDAAMALVTDEHFWRVGHDGEGRDPAMFKASVFDPLTMERPAVSVAEEAAIALTAAALRARSAVQS
jgi:hypothetical protein